MKARAILLVARRDYFAYVGAWGFWLSLITAPLLLAAITFAPILLARAEPPRALAIIADRAEDAALVRVAFVEEARTQARTELAAYVSATAPANASAVLQAFDAAPDADAIAAARRTLAAQAPEAMRAFPNLSPRYLIADAPSNDLEVLRAYLNGGGVVSVDGSAHRLYGLLRIRRDADGPLIEYWSVNLSHDEPSNIARRAMRLAMRREALAAQGLDPLEADRLDDLQPRLAQFDPSPGAGRGEVTLRQRAPFYAALALSFVLWSIVFSVANMLLSGVIEEKSNKILDTLLTSISPLELLIGKLIGVAAVSATLFLFWGALGGSLLTIAAERGGESMFAQVAAAFLEPRLLIAFGIGFVFGYLMYGAVFLALGSLCESLQEAQTLLGPVALVLAMPMMLIAPALDNPNAPLIEAASWVPIFTPFLLLIRAPSGLPWMEIAGMAGAMFVTSLVVLFLASRLFRAGVVDQLSLASMRAGKSKGG
ncbi:MAG: ABC transporter permease [Hyphomonadaceae bacterium]|nr:ABC transporter permease [Hyphomonadaceae bacterium]